MHVSQIRHAVRLPGWEEMDGGAAGNGGQGEEDEGGDGKAGEGEAGAAGARGQGQAQTGGGRSGKAAGGGSREAAEGGTGGGGGAGEGDGEGGDEDAAASEEVLEGAHQVSARCSIVTCFDLLYEEYRVRFALVPGSPSPACPARSPWLRIITWCQPSTYRFT